MAMSVTTKLKYDRFINEYIKTQNATQSAIKAGYTKKNASAQGSRLLKTPYIKERLEEHRKILAENDVADEAEILGYYTNVMRGKATDEVAMPTGVYEIRVQTKDRNKAAEMLGKHYAIWTDKKAIDATIKPVQIIDDVPEGGDVDG